MATSSTSTNSTFVTGGLILIVGALMLTYLQFLPNLKRVKSSYNKVVAEERGLQQDIKNLEQADSFLAFKKQELQGRGVNLEVADQVIPPTEEVPNLYIQLETLVTKNPGLSDIGYQLNTPVLNVDGNGVKVPITVNATGRYADLKTFLSRLETNIRPFVFTTIAFAQAADDGGSSDGTLILTATGYSAARNLSPLYSTATTVPTQ